jgi:hypothetical protein
MVPKGGLEPPLLATRSFAAFNKFGPIRNPLQNTLSALSEQTEPSMAVIGQ